MFLQIWCSTSPPGGNQVGSFAAGARWRATVRQSSPGAILNGTVSQGTKGGELLSLQTVISSTADVWELSTIDYFLKQGTSSFYVPLISIAGPGSHSLDLLARKTVTNAMDVPHTGKAAPNLFGSLPWRVRASAFRANGFRILLQRWKHYLCKF